MSHSYDDHLREFLRPTRGVAIRGAVASLGLLLMLPVPFFVMGIPFPWDHWAALFVVLPAAMFLYYCFRIWKPAARSSPATPSAIDQLDSDIRKLERLHSEGFLSKEEYDAKRRELVSGRR